MSAVLRLSRVRKNYQALRPLRMSDLSIGPGERVAISGLDAGAAEVLVNLVTGASVPDEGEVLVMGRSTASIEDGDEWLASLDRFGIVSPRAVLLDGATVLQNLAMPFTLEIDPVAPDMARRVSLLAEEVGIAGPWLEQPVAQIPAEVRARIHLARAVALAPSLLVLEHPTVSLAAVACTPFAADVARVAGARSLATLIISEDQWFAAVAAQRVYALQPSTGALTSRRVRRAWFGWKPSPS